MHQVQPHTQVMSWSTAARVSIRTVRRSHFWNVNYCILVCFWLSMRLGRKCGDLFEFSEKEGHIHAVMRLLRAGKWSLCTVRSTRTLTHAAQMLEAPQCDPLELQTGSFHTWGGTTKASSCCWLHTSPAEPWESAEPVYRPHTAASLAVQTPLCDAFLTDPTIPSQILCYWKFPQHFLQQNPQLWGYICCIMKWMNRPVCHLQWVEKKTIQEKVAKLSFNQ